MTREDLGRLLVVMAVFNRDNQRCVVAEPKKRCEALTSIPPTRLNSLHNPIAPAIQLRGRYLEGTSRI